METHLPNKFLHAHRKSHFVQWDGITWLTSEPISFTASICCYGHSEMPEESLSSKYFCIITILHDCVPKQQHPPPKVMTHLLCLVCSLWGACHLCHIWDLFVHSRECLNSSASPRDCVLIILWDFNKTNLSRELPKYRQHVTRPTRDSNILDHCCTTIKMNFTLSHGQLWGSLITVWFILYRPTDYQRRRGAPGLPEAEKEKSTRLRWCHTSLSEILCWLDDPHLHKDLQQITGTVWSLFMLQTSHHHPHPKEIQNYSTKWLQACGSNVCDHEVIWKTGAGPPEGHHWTLAGSSSVCLQSKQIFRRSSQHGTALCSATSRQTRGLCEIIKWKVPLDPIAKKKSI